MGEVHQRALTLVAPMMDNAPLTPISYASYADIGRGGVPRSVWRRVMMTPCELPGPVSGPLYHIGEIPAPRPNRHRSFEGPGLSVCSHPDGWRNMVNDTSELWRLRKPAGGAFVDMHDLTDDTRRDLTEEAIEAGLLRHSRLYRLDVWCPDRDAGSQEVVGGGEHWWTLFGCEVIAYQTLVGTGEDRAQITEVEAYTATERFEDRWGRHFFGRIPLVLAEELAHLAVFEGRGFDGAWWRDVAAPERLSYPRGVIFESALPSWTRELVSVEAGEVAPLAAAL